MAMIFGIVKCFNNIRILAGVPDYNLGLTLNRLIHFRLMREWKDSIQALSQGYAFLE